MKKPKSKQREESITDTVTVARARRRRQRSRSHFHPVRRGVRGMAKRGPDGTGRAVKHREGSIIGMVTRLHLDACDRIAQQVARKFPRSAFARRTRDGQGGAHVRWTLRQQRLGPGAS